MDRQVVVAHLAPHRRQGFQIGEQVAYVVELHALVGGVGKDRIVVAAVGRGALSMALAKLASLQPPMPPLVGRECWAVESAKIVLSAMPPPNLVLSS